MNNTKTQGKIAGLCFFLPVMYTNIIAPIIVTAGVGADVSLFFSFFWSILVLGIISIIFAVSLFVDNIRIAKIIRIVSVAFTVILLVYNLVGNLVGVRISSAISIIDNIISIAVGVITVIAIGKLGEQAQKLCYINMGLLLVQEVISSVSASSVSFIGVLTTVVTMAGYFFLGMYLSGKGNKEAKQKGTVASNSGDTIEKLSNLKGLLDKGIISQEEFDEKKKQLLGL